MKARLALGSMLGTRVKIKESKNPSMNCSNYDAWYVENADKVYEPGLWLAWLLLDEEEDDWYDPAEEYWELLHSIV